MSDRKQVKFSLPSQPQAAADKGQSRLGDGTRPIAIDRRLTTNRRTSLLLMVAAGTVAVALGASLFVAPLQRYFWQDRALDRSTEQLAQLRNVNAKLEAEVARLNTPSGVEEAAREEVGLQNPGEDRITIVGPDKVPTDLPAGWPYDLVTEITNTKRNAS